MRAFIYILAVVCVVAPFSNHGLFAASPPAKPGKPQPKPYVYLSGGVRKPGRYDWRQGMTLVHAIDAAGGFADSAARKVSIFHFDGLVEFYTRGGTNAPPVLEAGDRIFVPRRLL